ncbi:unnamed protein product [Rotaria sp. Silwood1]|nr:unnamed protein product [Rotaria sp. Silwood1]
MSDTLDSLKIISLREANWIGVNFFLRQDKNISNEIYFDERTPTKDVWSSFIKEAHKYNLRVLLKPLVVCGNDCLFIHILPENITKWFLNALSIGLELIQISNQDYTLYWKTLIRTIRSGGYSGLLTYCSIFYPLETQQIQF